MKAILLQTYATQVYVSLIGIVLMPMYLRYLGAEAFGLVGLHLMLQASVPVLDMGLTPALMREMSRFRAGSLGVVEAATRLRSLQALQVAIGSVVFLAFWTGSEWVATTWLSASELSTQVLSEAIALIGAAAILRWLAGLYRAALVGLEHHGSVNRVSAGFATLRFAGVLPLLMFVSRTPTSFFLFQVGASALELLVVAVMVYRRVPGSFSVTFDRGALVALFPIAGNMGILVLIWIVVTQIDKLILSGMLPLREYGYFTLAIAAAGGVLVLMPPLNQVVQPRLTILAEKGNEDLLAELYRLSSQFALIAFAGVGGTLAFFAEPILRIWSGSVEVASAAAPILFWYGLAYALVGVLSLPFMLQFARGKLRLHVLGNILLLFTLVPGLAWAARCCGATGSGKVFFLANLLMLLFWVPLVHNQFLPLLTWRWLLFDTLPIAAAMVGCLAISSWLLPEALPIAATLIWIGMAMIVAVCLGTASGEHSRMLLARWYREAMK